MDEFIVIAKLWPAGTKIDGIDSTTLLGPLSTKHTAAPFATSLDGTQNFQFLFWNTGRHITNKRSVRWNFSVLGWGLWTATKWYGTPGPGDSQTVRANAFTIGGDAPLSGTPIDATSTYAPATAWPFNGDDHVISTADSRAVVVAKDPFPSVASSSYDFAGWLQLVFGGDPTGEFLESDAGTSGRVGGTGFYDHVPGVDFPVAKGASADLIATYGKHNSAMDIQIFDRLRDWMRDWIYKVELEKDVLKPWIPYWDPNPMDLIRLKVLEQFLQQTRPGPAGGTDFQRLIEAAPRMSPEELKRAVQSLKTTLDLGKTALSALDAQLKRGGK